MKSLFTLPDKPIDQYRLHYYIINVNDDRYSLYDMVAIYHINTPYKLIDNNYMGRPLKDEWQIFIDDVFVGRNPSWDYYTRTRGIWDNCFLTKEDALNELIKQFNKRIRYHNKQIILLKDFKTEAESQLQSYLERDTIQPKGEK